MCGWHKHLMLRDTYISYLSAALKATIQKIAFFYVHLVLHLQISKLF